MRAGRLNRRVQYQTSIDTVDSFGQPVPTSWTTVFTCWGAIRQMSSREALVAGQVKAFITHIITVRYQGLNVPTISPLGRMLFVNPRGETEIYNLTAAMDVDQRHRQIDIYATEVVAPAPTP